MPLYDGKKLAQEGLLDVAGHCAQAALHAPQLTGSVDLKVEVVTGDELLDFFKVQDELRKVGLFTTAESYKTAYNAGEPPAVLLIGADCRPAPVLNWDCGACGYNTCVEAGVYCRERERETQGEAWGHIWKGPSCVWKIMELGIACDWAAAAAHRLNVETRVQLIPGGLFMRMGYLEGCTAANALPLGPCKEHWYFEPGTRITPRSWSHDAALDSMALRYPSLWIKFMGPGIDLGRTTMKDKDDFWDAPHRYLKMVEDPEFDKLIEQRMAKIVEVTDEIRRKRRAKKEEEAPSPKE